MWEIFFLKGYSIGVNVFAFHHLTVPFQLSSDWKGNKRDDEPISFVPQAHSIRSFWSSSAIFVQIFPTVPHQFPGELFRNFLGGPLYAPLNEKRDHLVAFSFQDSRNFCYDWVKIIIFHYKSGFSSTSVTLTYGTISEHYSYIDTSDLQDVFYSRTTEVAGLFFYV